MSAQQGIGGRHRRRRERATVLTAVPVALAVAWGGTAQAAPQDFVTAPDTAQSGTTDATPVPAPTSQREFLPGFTPSPQVQQSQWRSYDDYQSGRQQSSTTTAPVYYAPAPQQSAPAAPAPFVPPTPPPPPTVQRTVIAPVDAPEGTILIGSGAVARPDFIDARTAEQFNNSASALQADGANALVNAGLVDAPQADRVAAGAATGIVLGGAIGAAALGVPATAVGAVGGGLVGLGIGSATVPFVWWAPGIGWVFGPGVGAAIGAGVGAAALGVPAAVVGAGIGGAIGGAIGATALGGEQTTITEPAPASPTPAAEPAPVWTPPQDLAPVVDSAPAYIEQARTAVAEQPGGAAVLDAVDTAVADAAPVIEQGTAALNAALAPLGVAV
ncbi:hypothetical protein R4172_17940 [Rhodococcus kroppenstedtii]|uniref:hypothetical protein n=1 Tax=Rhodococcoides kroppenstedtii TaxID=293050 RepID=UPI002953638E|nr:hypothetical protein [Rhodococcus kroppenstedtii]MDV7199429.1 hypothetical protein [Rhodococcus kroppenstedtii]